MSGQWGIGNNGLAIGMMEGRDGRLGILFLRFFQSRESRAQGDGIGRFSCEFVVWKRQVRAGRRKNGLNGQRRFLYSFARED